MGEVLAWPKQCRRPSGVLSLNTVPISSGCRTNNWSVAFNVTDCLLFRHPDQVRTDYDAKQKPCTKFPRQWELSPRWGFHLFWIWPFPGDHTVRRLFMYFLDDIMSICSLLRTLRCTGRHYIRKQSSVFQSRAWPELWVCKNISYNLWCAFDLPLHVYSVGSS